MHSFFPKTGVIRSYSADAGVVHRHHIQCIIACGGVIRAVIANGIRGIQFAPIRLPLKRVSNIAYSPSRHRGPLNRIVEDCNCTRSKLSHRHCQSVRGTRLYLDISSQVRTTRRRVLS